MKWSGIAEIVSSVAIVVTLIYLTIQTEQNATAIVASSRNTVIESDLALISDLLAYPEINHAVYKPRLTPDEMSRLENWLIGMARSREHQWFQFRDGLLDEQLWDAFLSGLTLNVSYPRTRAWWNLVAYDYFDDAFVDFVNTRLAETPLNEDLRYAFEILEGPASPSDDPR
jgi:hypothetical protein